LFGWMKKSRENNSSQRTTKTILRDFDLQSNTAPREVTLLSYFWLFVDGIYLTPVGIPSVSSHDRCRACEIVDQNYVHSSVQLDVKKYFLFFVKSLWTFSSSHFHWLAPLFFLYPSGTLDQYKAGQPFESVHPLTHTYS